MRNHSYGNDFDLNENETECRTHFHMKGFALSLLNRGTRKLGNGLFRFNLCSVLLDIQSFTENPVLYCVFAHPITLFLSYLVKKIWIASL